MKIQNSSLGFNCKSRRSFWKNYPSRFDIFLNFLRDHYGLERLAKLHLDRRHMSASQVTSGAELCARFSRDSMMALILLTEECNGELAA